MSQNDLSIANQGFPAFRSDLNDALQALGSMQSGTTAPSTTYANMLWYDTTNNIVKMRNEDNDAWISLFTLDQSGDLVSALYAALVTVGDGSASAPSLTNDGDSNTGVYFPAADTVGVTTGGTERVRVDSSGNVGIGTSSPSTRLHVAGSNTATSQVTTQHTGSSITTIFGCDGSIDVGAVYVTTNHPLAFKTNNTERARIDSSGNLLVGTTSTLSSAKTTIKTPDGEGSQIPLCLAVGITSAGYGAVSFRNPAGQQGTIAINTASVSYNTTSDYRLKENITPMTGALAVVQQLNPVIYSWKSNGETTQGFIAHELAEVVPECVTGEKDAVDADGNPVYQGIDTSFLVATLTAAIQEQQVIIEQLKADVAALKSQA